MILGVHRIPLPTSATAGTLSIVGPSIAVPAKCTMAASVGDIFGPSPALVRRACIHMQPLSSSRMVRIGHGASMRSRGAMMGLHSKGTMHGARQSPSTNGSNRSGSYAYALEARDNDETAQPVLATSAPSAFFSSFRRPSITGRSMPGCCLSGNRKSPPTVAATHTKFRLRAKLEPALI